MTTPMSRPANNDEIVGIMGQIPASTVVAIARLGATVAELSQARAWLGDDAATASDLQHRCEGRVAEIVDLVTPDNVDDEDFG